MDRTICPSRRVVYIAALQQFIFIADRTVLARMIRDQGRTTKVSSSSQDLTSNSTSTCCSGWERSLSMVFAFTRRTCVTRVDCLCQGAGVAGLDRRVSPVRGFTRHKKSELRAHQMLGNCGVRASLRKKSEELSSNACTLKLRGTGLTPHKKSAPCSYEMVS